MKSSDNTTPFLERLFSQCEQLNASDIHIAVGVVPRMRLRGSLVPLTGWDTITAPETCAAAVALGRSTIPASCAERAAEIVLDKLHMSGAIDGAVSSLGGSRYRFNLFRENGDTAIALRRLNDKTLPLEALGLPVRLADFCNCPDGLVIVTGPTGSGKSTTLATLIDQINHTRDGHIITIEDPIEYIHRSDRCLVNQRQVGRDAVSFNSALVDSLRQDPDIILVGEIREVETIRTAITAAETGHLVFTTLHAGDCAGAIERIISVFPAGEQEGMRHQLALVLRGVFAQRLLPTADQRGRVPSYELMFSTPAIANLIATGRSQQIYSIIETSQAQGMITLEQSLAKLLVEERITERTAMTLAKNPNMLKNRICAAKEGGAIYEQ